jgi:hypothetical protein
MKILSKLFAVAKVGNTTWETTPESGTQAARIAVKKHKEQVRNDNPNISAKANRTTSIMWR